MRRDGITAHRDVSLWGRRQEKEESERLGLCHWQKGRQACIRRGARDGLRLQEPTSNPGDASSEKSCQ